MSDLQEEWRPVVGYEGVYEVSNLGRVRRLPGYKVPAPRVLNMAAGRNGYHSVNLCTDAKPRVFYVHRLVCEAFHGPAPTPRHYAAHADNVKTNNWVGNLRWATPKENSSDKVNHGTYSAKLTVSQVREIRRRAQTETLSVLAAEFGICKTYVSGIKNRVHWANIS